VELRKLTVRKVAETVSSGEISAHRLIEKTLKNCSVLNEGLNIFSHIAGIDALEQAKAIDRRVEQGESMPLAGIPVAVKDDICYGALPTSFGSEAFRDFYPPYTAFAVERLMDAGAVVIGKTNLDDMSMGSTTSSSPIGPTANPWDVERTAGSAGAAAVATGICMIALESDSGGALRHGASHCGVFGLRPTMGRVSRYGLSAFSSSFGQVGITAISGENVISALKVVSGFDERDASTAVCRDLPPGLDSIPEVGVLTIGYPAAAFDHLEPDLREVFRKAREMYAELGFRFVDIDLPLLPEALKAYYVIANAEASSNLSRYDGIRFGEAAGADTLDELYVKSRRLTFGPEARRRSVFGTFLLGSGNYDLYYRQALKVWNLVRLEFEKYLTGCDLIMLPAAAALPRHIAAGNTDFIETWAGDLFCAPVSLSGLPSLTVPAGQAGNLPVGLQLVGRPFSEELLAAAGDLAVQEVKLFPYGIL
jgi:aspartyl-tRNA(Asn)/glutamyl-tRNA(Gln) amidotransferase subunit A